MGKLGHNVCYICMKENQKVHSLSENDEDHMTYKEKLLYCIPNTLEGFDEACICRACISLLKGAYHFINMVINSQSYLKICNLQIDTAKSNFNDNDGITSNLNKVDVDTPDINNESDFVCKVCNISLKTRALLQKHFTNMHQVNVKSETSKTDKEVPDIVNIKSQFTCRICNTKLKTRLLLDRHFNRTHNTDKRYECKYCQKIFKQSWHLQDHLSTHTGEKKYKCHVCEKTFLRSSSLRRHFKTHERAPGEKVKPTPFLCSVCGKKFIYSNGLQRHMRVHLGIKQHECDICKRKFAQKTHLLAHMRTHTGEKPYVCDTCGDAFSLNASLRKHMGIHRQDVVNVKIEYNCYEV